MPNHKMVIGSELIGSILTVVDSKNKSLIGLKGKVIDETKNTITLYTKDEKEKKILKNQITIRLSIKNNKYEIDGKLLVGRPEQRLKKKIK